MSVAQIGFGMALSYADTVDGTYTPLVELSEITPAGWSVGKADATSHTSPDTAETSVPGLVTYKEMDAECVWSKTQYPAFTALKRLSKFWKVTYPDTSTDVFQGYITDVAPATPIKERMTCKIKIQPQTLSTFTPYTPS